MLREVQGSRVQHPCAARFAPVLLCTAPKATTPRRTTLVLTGIIPWHEGEKLLLSRTSAPPTAHPALHLLASLAAARGEVVGVARHDDSVADTERTTVRLFSIAVGEVVAGVATLTPVKKSRVR